MDKKKNLASGILLAALSVLCSLLLAETYIRLLLKDHVDTELLKSSLERASIKSFIQPSENPQLYFELKPNLDIDFQGSSIVTDANGYRISKKPQAEMQEGAVRIAVLGDSTSFGWRVDYESSYPEKYSQQIEADTNVPIELRNYSVPGYNSKQELYLFLDKIIDYQPDLLILHYDHNDSEPTGFYQPPNYMLPEYGDNPLNSALIKFTVRQLKTFQNRNTLNFDKDQHQYLAGYIVGGPLYDEHLLALQELAVKTQSLNIPSVVVLFFAFVKVDKNFEESPHYVLLHKNLKVELEEMGFNVLDLYPSYQAKMQAMGWSNLSNWWISKEEPLDGHPNSAGHQFIADRLVEYTHQQATLMKIFNERQTASQLEEK